MKKQFLILIMLVSASVLFAQGPISQGESQLNVGVGLSSRGIPVYFGFDYGVHPDVALGAELSYRKYDDNWKNDKYDHSIIGILGNANYHFNNILNIPSPWDFYAGLNLGYYNWNSPSKYAGSHSSGIGLGAQIGARYYFNNNIGVNLEFGGGNVLSGGKFGLTIKL